jgi:tetratricopeptide (TPR) repeat protein
MLKPEELDRVARLGEGKLAEIPFAVLLHAMAVGERTATVEVRRRQLWKEIVIDSGVPVHCRSNLAHEDIGRYLVSIGCVDQTTFNACLSAATAHNVELEELLVARGLVTPEELAKYARQNLARKLLDVFSWHDGTFVLGAVAETVSRPQKVNLGQLIVLGVTRFATQSQIDASIGALIGQPLAIHPEPPYANDDLRLSGPQVRVYHELKSRHLRIDQLATAGEMDYEELTRFLYALTLMGVVVPADSIAGLGPAGPPDVRVRNEQQDELRRLARTCWRMEPPDLLAVREGAPVEEIEQQFLRFAERFAPWTFDGDEAAGARKVFLAGARAFASLITPVTGPKVQETSALSPQGKPRRRAQPALLDADIQYRRGRTLMNSGEYGRAIEQLAYAVDLDPQNALFRSELAYCRFLDDPANAGETALAELKDALRLEPSCGPAIYYTGDILLRQGKIEQAKEALERAVKPMAPDRRPIEALQAIAAEEKKRQKAQEKRRFGRRRRRRR